MNKALIKIAYSQVIDSFSDNAFEQAIINASYEEFKMKSQAYNTGARFKTFTEMKANDGRANSLHYKSGFAIAGFMETLNNIIPHLKNSAGGDIAFDTYEFRVIESDITDIALHKVAIIYTTLNFVLLKSFGEYLLLSASNEPAIQPAEGVDTFLLKLQPGISIAHYREI